MQRDGRKRRVTTCMPCHTRKQKCNRQYPCNHCTKRRRPEECVYKHTPVNTSSQTRRSIAEPQNQSSENFRLLKQQLEAQATTSHHVVPDGDDSSRLQRVEIAKSFGYFEDSTSNTMALLKKWDLNRGGNTDIANEGERPDILAKIQRDLERIPRREIIDILIQYFVFELSWMKQLVHVPSFLTHYQRWWTESNPLSVRHTEFAVLIIRICAYAAQFLPSISHPADSINGLSVPQIRRTCIELGNSLSESCLTLDWKGSLVRAQHILFAALNSSCEGRTDKFWEGIASASRAAQKAGLHTASSVSASGDAGQFEKEMQRRTFCNLYLLDSHLSRQLDRVPFLPDDLVTEMLPQLRLASTTETEAETNNSSTYTPPPELFTERLMQVRLGIFWRKIKPAHIHKTPYDPTTAEARYESFCNSYLPTLHPALTLNNPNTTWDSSLPHLPKQRALLAIGVLDSVAANFRPLLLLTPIQIAQMPMYKRVLLTSQKAKLAHAALEELDAITTLHTMMSDGGPTRFAAIIFNSFESAVLLLTLIQQPDFPFELAGDGDEDESTILGRRVTKLTYAKVFNAVEKALIRLRMLSSVSEMARSGAGVVETLFDRAKPKANARSHFESEVQAITLNGLVESAGEGSIVPDDAGGGGGGLLPDSFTDFLGLDMGGVAGDVFGYPSSWGVADGVDSGSFNGFPSAGFSETDLNTRST